MAIAAPRHLSKQAGRAFNLKDGTSFQKVLPQEFPASPAQAEHTTKNPNIDRTDRAARLPTGILPNSQIPTIQNLEETSYGRIYAHCVN